MGNTAVKKDDGQQPAPPAKQARASGRGRPLVRVMPRGYVNCDELRIELQRSVSGADQLIEPPVRPRWWSNL